jgi:hypothetical protein
MYLVPVKAAITEALRSVFTSTYPEPDFRDVHISIEYPIEQSNYPGIWVQYEDNDDLAIAGIGHVEYIHDTVHDTYSAVTRWRFKGAVTLTIAALSSLERDRLYDEMVRVFAFGEQDSTLKTFRDKIETNDLVGMNANFDDLRPFGDAATPGTPWETDEIIYEKSLSFDLIGEFVGVPGSSTLVPLSSITFIDYVEGSPVPKFPQEPDSTVQPGTPGDWDRTSWT